MWFNEPIVIGGIAGSILLSFKQDARTARLIWEDEFRETLEDVENKSREISDHLATARKGSKYNFIVNLHGSAMHVMETAQSLLNQTEVAADEMDHLIAQADEERAKLMASVSPIISHTLKQEIKHEVKLLDNVRVLVGPDLNRLKQERHDLRTALKRLRVLNDEIRIAVGARYGSRGKVWCQRQEARNRRSTRIKR